MVERGVIQHRDRAKQLNNFKALIYERGITPTDIDGAIDFDAGEFIFFEIKYAGKPVDKGQRLFFENVCTVLIKGGATAVAFITDHHVDDPNIDVDADKTKVREYFYDGKWNTPKSDITLKIAINKIRPPTHAPISNTKTKCKICGLYPADETGICSICADAEKGWNPNAGRIADQDMDRDKGALRRTPEVHGSQAESKS